MLFPKTYDDIYTQIVTYVTKNTPITNLTETSTLRIIAEAVARALSGAYDTIDSYYNNAFLSTATGEALDRIGESYGVYRHRPTIAYAENSLKFYINPLTGYTVTDLLGIVNAATGLNLTSIVIKAGTVVRSPADDGGFSVDYITTEDATLTNNGVFVPVQSTGTGSMYNVGQNVLTSHNIKSTHLELYTVADFIRCTNVTPIDTAQDYESDNDYRARIYNAILALGGSNLAAVLKAALAVPGVSTAVVRNNYDGPGTVAIFVVSTTPTVSQGILHAVHQAVSHVAPVGVKVMVSSPAYRFIRLKVQLAFTPEAPYDEQQRIKVNVRRAVLDYTNNLPLGGTWVVHEVTQRIMDVSDNIADFKQVAFMSDIYMNPLYVGYDGRLVSSSVVPNNRHGTNIVWYNINAGVNEKFVMLSDHLIIC